MAIPYTRPGITFQEDPNPVVQPLLGEATSVCLVGPAQGFQSYVETLVLTDNTPVTLGATFPDVSTIAVVDASDLTSDPFTPSTVLESQDYDLDTSNLSTTGAVTIARSMQTTIPDGETVAVYFENDASPDTDSSFTDFITLDGVTTAAPNDRSSDTQAASIRVMSPGKVPSTDYAVTGAGTDACTIAGVASPSVVGTYQTLVYEYNQATNDAWAVTVTGGPAGGTFTITLTKDSVSHTTSGIAYNASDSTCQSAVGTALANFSGLSSGDVRVTRSGAGSSGDPYVYVLTFQGDLAGQSLVTVTASGASLTGGSSPGTTVAHTVTASISDLITDQTIQLNDTTDVNLPDDSINHVFRTVAGTETTTAVLYSKGTTTDLDYIVSGSGATTLIARSAGTTTMSPSTDQITVRVTYQATPLAYWYPTRVYSQIDAEQKYGAAMDSSGNINSPISLAAAIAFNNGISNVIIQPLFTENEDGTRSAPTGTATDWESTFANLRGVDGINVIVPLVSTGGLSTSDTVVSEIMTKLQTHVQYMRVHQNKYISVVGSSDSTVYGQGSQAALQALATQIRGGLNSSTAESQQFTLLSPASYRMQNPVTGATMTVGGQYAAAAFAGGLARRAIQEPMTRKGLTTIFDVAETRTDPDKDADASAGLTVMETVRGVLQCRHAITLANDTVANRELNVVRAKFYHIDTMRNTLNQLIGTLLADAEAPFSVSLASVGTLEALKGLGVIVSYDGVQSSQVNGDPTHIQLRYRYLPAYPLNYITVNFSLDTTSNTVTTTQVSA